MRLDFLGLQAFLAIAERGSFHRAAAHLGITQTALSHRIRKFEDELREKLFIRTTRAVSLTPAGLALLPKARQLLDDAESLFAELGSRADSRHENVAIGCLPTVAVNVMPTVIAAFHKAYPTTAVRISTTRPARSPSACRRARPSSVSPSLAPGAGTWRSVRWSRSRSC